MSRLDAAVVMKELATAKTNQDVQVFFGEVFKSFGGFEGFANELAECIKASEDGSNAKTQALVTLAKLFFQYGQLNDDNSGLVDEATVQAQLHEILNENNKDSGNGDADGLDPLSLSD